MTELLQVLTLMAMPVMYFLTVRTIIVRQNRIAAKEAARRRPRYTAWTVDAINGAEFGYKVQA